jgi:ADP-heptose:LPS heptosyltransferase
LFKSAVLAWLSGAGRRVGFSQQSRRERLSAWFSNEHVQLPAGNKHVIEIYQALVEACGVSTGKFEFPLPPTPMQEQYVKAQLDRHQLRNFIVINPGAGWVTKMWAAANYALLGKRIQKELKLPVIFTWGPQEEHLIAEIRSVIGQAHCIDFPTTFLDLIPLLQRAQLFIGGDTGPMQLAAALGIPIVAIFSSTNPDRNGPFSPQDISVHRKLFCSNCYLRQCPYRLECLEISVDEVFSAVQTRLVSAIK